MIDDVFDLFISFFNFENFKRKGYKISLLLLAVVSLILGLNESAILFAAWLVLVIFVELFFSDIADNWLFKMIQILLLIAVMVITGLWLFKYFVLNI